MPTFGRTAGSKWHVVGPDGCRYGSEFGDGGDRTPAETVTATDVVAYRSPESSAHRSPESVGGGDDPREEFVGLESTDRQRLVLPRAIRESDSDLCHTCRSTLETHQQRRARVIRALKRATPLRAVAWDSLEFESLRSCYWCRAHERTLWRHDGLDARVCPACGRLYDSPLGDPGPDGTPDADRRPETPGDPVTPIVLGIDRPDYDPADLVGGNRPVIEFREGREYATLKLSLESVGHAFMPGGIAELEAVRAAYADRVADDHGSEVTVRIGDFARTVTLAAIAPDDAPRVIDDCWPILSDPQHWYRLGWGEYAGEYPRSPDQSIPGTDPVAEAFPRLRTRAPASSVDTDHLRQVTEPGRYQRGQRYYERGAVTAIERVDDLVRATVQGSQPYDVRVTLADGRFVEGQCTCPDDAVPCKHVVATVLESGDVEAIGTDRSLEAILEGASAEQLRTLLSSAAREDLQLRRRLYEELDE